jgi:hypothetical protein
MDEWNNDSKGTDLRQTPGGGPKEEGKKSPCETTNISAYKDKKMKN